MQLKLFTALSTLATVVLGSPLLSKRDEMCGQWDNESTGDYIGNRSNDRFKFSILYIFWLQSFLTNKFLFLNYIIIIKFIIIYGEWDLVKGLNVLKYLD